MREASPLDAVQAQMAQNLRILPWWWVLRWMWLGEAIWVIYLIEERGLSIGQVLAFEAAFGVTVLLAEVPTGIVADRYSRRLSLLLAGIITSVGFLTFGLATGVSILLVSYIAFGIGEAFTSGADSALLFESLKALGRDDEFARRVGFLNGMLTALIAVSTLVGATLVIWLPLSAPILISAALTLPSLGLLFFLREPPRTDERSSFVSTGRLALMGIVRRRSMWSFILIWVSGGVTIATMGVTLPIILVRSHDAPIWAVGVVMAVQLLLATAGSWLAAPLVRRFGLRPTVAVMAIAGPLSLLAGASGLQWLIPLFLLPSITFNVLFVHLVDFLSRRVPDSRRATTVSIASMTSNIGFIGAALLLGQVADARGVSAALVTGAVTFSILGSLSLLVWWRSGDTAPEPLARPSESGVDEPAPAGAAR